MSTFLSQLAADLALAAKKPNVLAYTTNSEIHEAFHKSDKIGRILRGGNRSGKSVAGVVESIWRSTGRHPYQVTHDLPTRGRIVTVDRDNGIKQIILPLLKQWVPPSELRKGSWEDSYSNSDKLFTFRNGSTIELKTHQQEVEAFAGVPLHWIWYDEECPQAIYNECRLRLIDYNGVWYMTMTPVAGQDWIFDRFIVTKNKNVAMFEVDISDNPHLPQAALDSLDEDLSEDEKAVRQKGIFVPKGGLILREFDYSRHVITAKREIPKSWSVYVSCDHGFNNPTAILWHAVSKQGEVVTFKEHYQRRWVIKQHAERIREINAEYDVEPVIYMCDPSMAQRTAETGTSALQLYRENGIPFIQAKRDVDGRINKMNEYLKYDMWHIMDNCGNTIKEARGYAFKAHHSAKIADRSNLREEPNPKNNHSMDSSGYFFNFMPMLNSVLRMEASKRKSISKTITNPEDFPWEVDSSFYPNNEVEEYGFGEA